MNYHDAFEPDTFYHIFNHAVGNENLFRNDDNYRYFLKKYDEYTSEIFDTYAFCLMPNHFHLLVKTKPINKLQFLPNFSKNQHEFFMQKFSNFLNSYAKSYNKKFERKGALFLDFTKRTAVKDETYLLTLVNYIHQNPVKHGFCKSLEGWPYSSYLACLSKKKTKIKRDELLTWFGGKTDFEKFHLENQTILLEELEFK